MIAVIAAVLVGAVGAVVRYAATRALVRPWGVLVVNVVGSAIGGAVLGLAERAAIGADIRLIVLGGLCGGLTTFSTFSVETIQFAMERKWRVVAFSVGANLLVGIAAATAGYLVVRS